MNSGEKTSMSLDLQDQANQKNFKYFVITLFKLLMSLRNNFFIQRAQKNMYSAR